MSSDTIKDLLQDRGPFASVYVEVSRDTEDGNRMAELRGLR